MLIHGFYKAHLPQCDPRRCQHKSERQNAISVWSGLALSQRYGMLGPAWKAAGMGITDCSSGSGRSTLCFPKWKHTWVQPWIWSNFLPAVFSSKSQLCVYDVFPPKFEMKGGTWVIGHNINQPVPDPNDKSLGNYYIDPARPTTSQDKDGGYHMRKVVGAVDRLQYESQSKFIWQISLLSDSLILHPGGFAIGVNQQYCKLYDHPSNRRWRSRWPIASGPFIRRTSLKLQWKRWQTGLLFFRLPACSLPTPYLFWEQIISRKCQSGPDSGLWP